MIKTNGMKKLESVKKVENFVQLRRLDVFGKINKPGTAKVGAISKGQNCKRGDPLGFVKLQLVAKYEKK